MTARSLRALMLGGLALPFAFATASLAQDHAAAPPPAGAEEGHHHHGWGDPAEHAAMMARHLEHEAARLRDILQLRPDQEGALHAFLDSMKPPADMMERMRKDHDEAEHLTTPQRLDRMLAKMDEHHAHMVAHIEAVKRFYAQLSPAQQKAFDAMGPMMHGRHGMGGPGMGGHHGPMGGPPDDGPMGGPPPAA
ncbi:MAG: Spy/CpxP family protein refolding chaperone [Proteobacteria bacterium]|nr:Spy/CpxP family protein refolding chaperone [Pseudomonadota bacterium]